ncbi:DUF4180 domain-containing protein [Actinoalloteichus hymeniacidonis]|uniref:DUF4180 family protein n=1 Tax=Actinoalloteichus hymeniacidonis TaxID=340345 RepID=A0AAC9HNB5_9PSEU|nr:DUF4180 domain-containing protein [Actinoalloteichus hymeniacidonis]AOS62366.1 putative DUF4180 family protein [Actinoalloteichus hymeniacidonis]MBB5909606.1 hypothetical protein [Actinoalloteichus hymeniacidonis]
MIDTAWGVRAYTLDAEGVAIGTERDATDLIGELWELKPELVVIPVQRFVDGFFRLETRLAGDFTQKLVNYGFRLAILGDVSEHIERSSAFAGYVREANRGRHIWFVADRDELRRRLQPDR